MDLLNINPPKNGHSRESLTEVKSCQECGEAIVGRTDKKFCCDQCRTSFNNRQNCDETNYGRHINHILRKNRRILNALNVKGKTRVSGTQLREKGFDFGFFTNLCKTKDNAIYYYCYEQGYRPLEKEYYLLVVKQDIHL